MKARKHPRVCFHCEVNQTNVDKLRVLAEEEASLFGDSQDHRENREAYLYALDELVEKLQRQQVMAFQFRNDLTVGTGKEYFDKYLQFLQIIHSDHQGLQKNYICPSHLSRYRFFTCSQRKNSTLSNLHAVILMMTYPFERFLWLVAFVAVFLPCFCRVVAVNHLLITRYCLDLVRSNAFIIEAQKQRHADDLPF